MRSVLGIIILLEDDAANWFAMITKAPHECWVKNMTVLHGIKIPINQSKPSSSLPRNASPHFDIPSSMLNLFLHLIGPQCFPTLLWQYLFPSDPIILNFDSSVNQTFFHLLKLHSLCLSAHFFLFTTYSLVNRGFLQWTWPSKLTSQRFRWIVEAPISGKSCFQTSAPSIASPESMALTAHHMSWSVNACGQPILWETWY